MINRTKTNTFTMPEIAATRTSSVLLIMPHIRIGSFSVRERTHYKCRVSCSGLWVAAINRRSEIFQTA